MNKQRKVLITITYNEIGIIIDTKAEEVAQPERKKGRWLDSEGKEKYVGYCGECSACGGWSEYITDFCPNCGADMRGDGE